MKQAYVTLEDAATQLGVSQKSLSTSIANKDLAAWILADDLNGVFVPKLKEFETAEIGNTENGIAAFFPDRSCIPTKEAVATEFWQLDPECARQIVTKGSYHACWLVPSIDVINSQLTSSSLNWLFFVRESEGRNLITSESLYLAEQDVISFFCSENHEIDKGKNTGHLTHDPAMQLEVNKLAAEYIKNHGVRPKLKTITNMLDKKGLYPDLDAGSIYRRTRKTW